LLTGKLAEPSLRRVAEALTDDGKAFAVHRLTLSVAALMTTDMILRQPPPLVNVDRVIVPGFCAGDLDQLSVELRVPVERGPQDLKDLPVHFGEGAYEHDLSRYDIMIFAEIVDAPNMSIEEIIARAERYKKDGADVIDLGCLPGVAFPHLRDSVSALKEQGFSVSVDSLVMDELRAGGLAGADYLLSLKSGTLELLEEVSSIPVLIPEESGDLDSLAAAIEWMLQQDRPFLADSILDPIHFGFTESLLRYAELRRRYPDIEIMMGIGNLTELTDADTGGMNMLLVGIMSELGIRHLLTTEVSKHARTVVREIDAARRIMYRAREDHALPRGYTGALMALHEKRPFPYSLEEIEELASQIRDPNYRIQVSESALHVYNRDGLVSGIDPYDLFPHLKELEHDPSHAFYMGVELARAEIALRLGKRFIQDNELAWGAAGGDDVQKGGGRHFHHKEAGSTLKARRQRRKRRN
jgi:dihydropteroate synthase-like protein